MPVERIEGTRPRTRRRGWLGGTFREADFSGTNSAKWACYGVTCFLTAPSSLR